MSGIHHVTAISGKASKNLEFYTRTLGLKVAYEQREWGAAFLSFGDQHHDLALFQLATGETPDDKQPGLHHMAWQLGSFEELQAARVFLKEELEAKEAAIAATKKTLRINSLEVETVTLRDGLIHPDRIRERIRAEGPTAPRFDRQHLDEDGHVSI